MSPYMSLSASALLLAGSAFARPHLEARQSTPNPIGACDPGLRVVAVSGDGAKNVGEYGLIGTLADGIVASVPGSSSITLNYDKASANGLAKTTEGQVLLDNYLTQYNAQCPDSKIAVIGYSAGAIISGNELCGGSAPWPTNPAVSSTVGDQIVGAIFYGDERRTDDTSYNAGTCQNDGKFPRPPANAACGAFNSKIRSYCNDGDPQCCLGFDVDEHYVYPQEYDQDAIAFITNLYNQAVASSSTSSSAVMSSTMSSVTPSSTDVVVAPTSAPVMMPSSMAMSSEVVVAPSSMAMSSEVVVAPSSMMVSSDIARPTSMAMTSELVAPMSSILASSAPPSNTAAPVVPAPTPDNGDDNDDGADVGNGDDTDNGDAGAAPAPAPSSNNGGNGAAPSATAPIAPGTPSPASGSGPAAPSAPQPISSPQATACPSNLDTSFQFPHLIVPVNKCTPDQAYGTQYNGKFDSDTSSIFNFDIPADYAGKQCSLIFFLPEKSSLQYSSFTTSGGPGIHVNMLESPATQQTTYNSVPDASEDFGDVAITPGSGYVIKTSSCPAGQRIGYEVSATGDYSLEYFQASGEPIGLYVRAC